MPEHAVAPSICALNVLITGFMLQLRSKFLYTTVINAGAANTFQLTVTDSIAMCMATHITTVSGSHVAWWAKLTVGVGVAAILALRLCCLLMCLVRQKRRQKAKGAKWSLQQDSTPAVQAMASATQPTRHCSNVAAYDIERLTADNRAGSTSRFSSAPDKGTEAELGLMQARTTLKPLGVDQVNMQAMNATSNLSAAIGNASITQKAAV